MHPHQHLVDNGTILEIECGSHLYGTNVATSDVDQVGVFLAPKQFYLGLNKIEEIELGIVSKKEDGKNASDAVDRKFYELRKFIRLAKGGNPNIVEILFAPVENTITCNGLGWRIFENADMFVSQKVREKYLGYSLGQKKKMVEKPENFVQTNAAYDWLQNWLSNEQNDPRTKIAAVLKDMVASKVADDKITHLVVGNANYNASMTVKKLNALLKEKLAKITNRQDLWTKYGYDTKFAMHLLRLLYEGIEIMETGRIEFPLKNREFLLEVRNGNYSKEEVLEIAAELEAELKVVESDLPMEPDDEKVDKFLISLVEQGWSL